MNVTEKPLLDNVNPRNRVQQQATQERTADLRWESAVRADKPGLTRIPTKLRGKSSTLHLEQAEFISPQIALRQRLRRLNPTLMSGAMPSAIKCSHCEM